MRVLSAFFFLGLAACVKGETCPEKLRCKCKTMYNGDINVYCTHMQRFDLSLALDVLSGKKDVNLWIISVPLGKVPSNFFNKNIGIKSLFLHDCYLYSLDNEHEPALLGLEDSLRELQIFASFSDRDGRIIENLGHLENLEYIGLISNIIPDLSNYWFKDGFPSLKKLEILFCGIERLGDRAFANLSNLKTLDLRGNTFGRLRRSMFPVPAKFTSLYIESTPLKKIPKDLFSNMPSLKNVSFQSTGISRLEQKLWKPVWQHLEDVDVKKNPLVCDSRMRWMFEIPMPNGISGDCTNVDTNLFYFIKRKGHVY